MDIKIDTSGLDRLMREEPTRIEKAVTRGINDTAFSVRRQVPDILRQAVDRPTAFTTRSSAAVVEKAVGADPRATVSIAAAQAEYLQHGEFGTPSERLISPTKRYRDRYGNLLKRFRARNLDTAGEEVQDDRKSQMIADRRTKKSRKAKARVGRFFEGRPRGRAGRPAGIYERWGGNKKLRLIAAFEKRKQNRPQFDIRGKMIKAANAELRDNILKRLDD